MDTFLIRRRLSAIEIAGRWFAFAVVVSALTTLMYVELDKIFRLPPNPKELREAYESWILSMAGTLPIVAVLAIVPRLLPRSARLRLPLLALTVFAAAWLGWLGQETAFLTCGCTDGRPPSVAEARAMQHWLVVVAVLIAALGEYQRSFSRAAESLHQAELDRMRLQSELAAGRLQLLQAQIEPHFLFNSLANVRRLLRTDGAAGRSMLADLLGYLESALPRLREEEPTLEREVEVVRAFLGVHQVRMGQRLQVDFDVPAELGQRVVPPMMLLTLVENALKHGLQPLLEGGSIRIGASSEPGLLRMQVADTGRGLGTSLGAGTGLANIRARLRAMYGAAAKLSLRVNEPRGVVAMIELPLAAS